MPGTLSRRKRFMVIGLICLALPLLAVALPMACRPSGSTSGEIYVAVMTQSGWSIAGAHAQTAQLLWTDDLQTNAEVLLKQGVLHPPPLTGQMSKGAVDHLKARSVIIVEGAEVDALRERIFGGAKGQLWTFSEPVIAPGGRAIVKGEMYCGSLCADGSIYVLEKQGGTWKVVETITIWMS